MGFRWRLTLPTCRGGDKREGPLTLSADLTLQVLRHRRLATAFGMAIYLAAYVLLDWVSLIHPFGSLAITPWNPPAGLTFALFLHHGFRFMPAAAVAVVLADVLFHGLAVAPFATVASAFVIAGTYAAAAASVRRWAGISPGLHDHRDLLWLLAAGVCAATVTALLVVGLFLGAGMLRPQEYPAAVLHYWVGDVIGIAVLTPFLLLVLDPRRSDSRGQAMGVAEPLLQLAAIGLGLWVIFGLESTDHFEFSYALFLPLIWIALRRGLWGASWGILVTQLGLVLAIQLKGGYAPDLVAQFQLLLLAVAVTGLFLGSVVDERRRAQGSLRDSEARLRALIGTAPDAIITVDEAGRAHFDNRAAERLFAGRGRPPRTVRVGELLPELGSAGAQPAAGLELTAHRLDGTTFAAEVAIGEARIHGRRTHVAIVRDVSARKAAEQQLKRHQAELAHVARVHATGEMAAALAHELNQPLTAVSSFARAAEEVLRSSAPGPEAIRSAIAFIGQAVRQATRAGQIIRSTREFLRRGDSRSEKVELARVFDAVGDLVRAELAQSGLRLRLETAPRLPAVLADPIQVEQVILNLVHNSMEAMLRAELRDGTVTLRADVAADDPGAVEIAVRDTGPGFPPEIADRLFTPFATTKETGMGLGLSISRSIVEAHGGRIWAAPQARGADLRFTLPVYRAAGDDEA